MGGYNQKHGGDQKPKLVRVKELFEDQHQDTQGKNKQGLFAMVMFPVSMGKRIASDGSSQQDHENLKPRIVDDVDSQHRKACQYQRQKRTVDGAGYRSGNSKGIVVNLQHGGQQN